MFGAPTGLLAISPPVQCDTPARIPTTDPEEEFIPETQAAEERFCLGGLLGNVSSGTITLESTDVDVSEPNNAFEPNGLLGGTIPTRTEAFQHTGLLSPSGEGMSVELESGTVAAPPLSQSQDDDLPEVHDILRPYATTSASVVEPASLTSIWDSNIVRASTFGGKPHFIGRRMRRSQRSTSTVMASNDGKRFSQLLDVPIHRLLDDLSRTAATKLAQPEVEPSSKKLHKPSDTSLWVDRYRPQRFTDLLGDDRVHREVMTWVKEWEWCVFGKSKAKGRGIKRPRSEEGENQDEWRRPQEKLLLLSGPPGLGKTTLAHVVAKHAGYSVYEINASDARSAQVVDERIRPALETGYTIGSSKPIMVVIDEIDGATGGTDNSSGFVQRLIQLTYDRPKKKGKRNETQNTARPLLRPIICICNDLYASSLAKLRQHARIVRFNRPNDLHLVRRLRDICVAEGLKTESRALSTLVGVSRGDLRGCLNTLQLMKARNEEVTVPVIQRAIKGMKEEDTSQVAVLNDLFTPMSRKRVQELGLTEEEEAKYVWRLSREIEGGDGMDKIAVGCFEHYANLHQHDGNFSRHLKAAEWLVAYDVMSGTMRAEREYAMLQYLSYTLVPFYPLFQERGGTRVERPKADWENYTQTKANEEIYKALAKNLRTAGSRFAGDYRHLASDHVLRLEFAPFINRIISPPLRPVNSQVIRPSERMVLSRLVDIMLALELRFFQEKADDGQLVYRLDPPIDVFVTYDGKRASDILGSRYALRHLVAEEIEAKLALHSGAAGNIAASYPFGPHKSTRNLNVEDGEGNTEAGADGTLLRSTATDTAPPPNKRKKVEPPAEKIATDFFGRPIIKKDREDRNGLAEVSQETSTVKKPYSIAYKFREGNSAAVRKPVKVFAFL